MLVVGLTGNIASGKSVVAARLAALGATLVDADLLSREAVRPGTPAHAAIVRRWGSAILEPSGAIDRGALRRIVFADVDARRELEAIVHPEVSRLRVARLAEARLRGDRLVVCDIPLLFEAGLEGTVDQIVLVDAPEETRRARLIRDRGLSTEEADAMLAAQQPAAPKRARAHLVVDNVGTLDELLRKATALFAELEALAKGSA